MPPTVTPEREFLRFSGRRTYRKLFGRRRRHDFEPTAFDSADLVSSLLLNGRHRPVIDLDVPHHCVPSSTEGHSHLYIDVDMSWFRYRLLLWVLMYAGIIDRAYYRMALRHRQTMVRMPGVAKMQESAYDGMDSEEQWVEGY